MRKRPMQTLRDRKRLAALRALRGDCPVHGEVGMVEFADGPRCLGCIVQDPYQRLATRGPFRSWGAREPA